MLNPELFSTIIWISILNLVAVTLTVLLLIAAATSRRLHLARANKKPDQI
jgi:hypothetical protein